jgi:hypothetical protein
MLSNDLRRGEAVLFVFNQLPVDPRRKIGMENAMRIYRSEYGARDARAGK